MLESVIQTKIIKKLESDGWLVLKIIKLSQSGYPDLMALKNGVCHFIEVKQTKGVLSEIQKYRIDQLRSIGFQADVWTDYKVNYER